jgi:hypothetical protein
VCEGVGEGVGEGQIMDEEKRCRVYEVGEEGANKSDGSLPIWNSDEPQFLT